MRISRMLFIAATLASTVALTGCDSKVKKENVALTNEVNDLRNQMAERNKALEDCNNDLRSRDQQLAELRRGMGSGTETASGGSTGFEGIEGVKSSASAGEVTASVESDLLFDSGKTTLKTAAKKSLDQVVSVLNSNYGSDTVRIVGYTDSDPIKKSGYKSNYHLGFERAYAVREYLISKGIDAKRISLASFGPDAPMGSKAQSRRVAIVVILGT